MKEVVIAGAARTPMGGFQGMFDGVTAAELGGTAIRAALEGAGATTVDEVLKKQQASCRNFLFDSQDQYRLMSALDKDLLGGVPYTILIKPGGEVIYRGLGTIDPLELKKAIVGYLGRYYK